jgi:WhiB family transcriptional regulator, redox-sensing transcriptional regulator
LQPPGGIVVPPRLFNTTGDRQGKLCEHRSLTTAQEEDSIQAAVDNPEKLDWQEQAACRSYDNVLFFGPDQGESEREKQAREARAKAVCQRCPVADPCLEFAMETNQKYGIWGGLTDKERASLKRRRARARRAS